MKDFEIELAGRTLEYYDADHLYSVDGVIVPSITQMLKYKFGGRYAGVDNDTLRRAAAAGTRIHEAIEVYCKEGFDEEFQEVKNFKFLQKHYGFNVVGNEVPVILFDESEPVAAGRLDLVLEMGGELGGADIKRVTTLDKEYLAYQLNLYRIAYRQCYGKSWEFLRGVQLHGDIRRFTEIPINEDAAMAFIKEWRSKHGGF